MKKVRLRGLGVFLWMLCVMVGCGDTRPASESRSIAIDSISSGPVIREITYQPIAPDKRIQAEVEILVDSSASMQGFKASLPPILHSVDEALSYSKKLYFDVSSKKTCFFNGKAGVFACQNRVDGVPIPNAVGYTNLDRAVQVASDKDLTIIITDGVPSGLSSGKECVGSGVDAGCVAEALSEAVRGKPGASTDQLRGVWMVPIITNYQGLFFTEERLRPADVDLSKAELGIRNTFGTNARIDKPRVGSDGTLLYDYTGPRFLIAIVIGDVNTGRAFLQEWFEHLSFSEMVTVGEASGYKGGTALAPAFEVFPSAVPTETYASCQQTKDERGRIIGDLVNCSQIADNRFKLSCRPKPSTAELMIGAEPHVHGFRLILLAPAKVSLHARGNAQPKSLNPSLDHLSIRNSCGTQLKMKCGLSETRIDVTSAADLSTAAAEVISDSSPSGKLMQELSTRSPASEPYKVYGLADLLENFYKRKLPISRSDIAQLRFCED